MGRGSSFQEKLSRKGANTGPEGKPVSPDTWRSLRGLPAAAPTVKRAAWAAVKPAHAKHAGQNGSDAVPIAPAAPQVMPRNWRPEGSVFTPRVIPARAQTATPPTSHSPEPALNTVITEDNRHGGLDDHLRHSLEIDALELEAGTAATRARDAKPTKTPATPVDKFIRACQKEAGASSFVYFYDGWLKKFRQLMTEALDSEQIRTLLTTNPHVDQVLIDTLCTTLTNRAQRLHTDQDSYVFPFLNHQFSSGLKPNLKNAMGGFMTHCMNKHGHLLSQKIETPEEKSRRLDTRKFLTTQKHPFEQACLETAIVSNPLQLQEPNKHLFEGVLAQALESKANHLVIGEPDYLERFPQRLGDFVLRIAVHRLQTEPLEFLVEPADGNGGFVLKPPIADAVEAFAQHCVRYHGHHVQDSPAKDTAYVREIKFKRLCQEYALLAELPGADETKNIAMRACLRNAIQYRLLRGLDHPDAATQLAQKIQKGCLCSVAYHMKKHADGDFDYSTLLAADDPNQLDPAFASYIDTFVAGCLARFKEAEAQRTQLQRGR